MTLLNTLAPWQWLVVATVPPLVVLLYFLKLKRVPLEVPSTYLWRRAIEDLHVNTIWQRLRQSLLLFLQLLLLALLAIALLRPGYRGTQLLDSRLIFLIDNSASMSATDVEPNRLESAKREVLKLIDQMKSTDTAMVLSFSDVARVEQPFTNNRRLLRQRVSQIQPTQRPSDLGEALRAASGLANPGRTSESENVKDLQVADPLPATLYLYSDGGFAAVPNFSLGNLTPKYVPIGIPEPRNVGIVAFNTERNPEKPTQLQAFVRLENFGTADEQAEVSLYINGTLLDAQGIKVSPGNAAGVRFSLQDADEGVLEARLKSGDDLAIDDIAYTSLRAPRRGQVLVVTPGNEPLKLVFGTEEALKVSLVAFAEPAILETTGYEQEAEAGAYDLVIYDRCRPKKMPQANTLFIGQMPPVEGWTAGKKSPAPLVIDVDRVHPLTQLVELGNVRFVEGFAVTAPEGASELITADIGSLFTIAARQGFEDAVLGTEIFGTEGGKTVVNTDWHIRRSFPVFFMNVLHYLGGSRVAATLPSVQPGQPVTLKTLAPVEHVRVRPPQGQDVQLGRDPRNNFVYPSPERLGVYDVREGDSDKITQQFAVNLFDARESDLRPAPKIELGHSEVKGQSRLESARQELWRWLLMGGLAVLLFEWYVYNRRVYL